MGGIRKLNKSENEQAAEPLCKTVPRHPAEGERVQAEGDEIAAGALGDGFVEGI